MSNNNLAIYPSPEAIPGYDTLPYLQRELLRAKWEEQVANGAPATSDDNETGV